MRKSHSHPSIGIDKEFRVKDLETGEWLPIYKNHSSSIVGPAFYYKNGKKPLMVSLIRVAYEAYIKEAPLAHGEAVRFIDYDENNLSLDNLELTKTGRKKEHKKNLKPDGFDDWFGGDSIYI